jgi:cytochrome c-type biogenesis protein CcmE
MPVAFIAVSMALGHVVVVPASDAINVTIEELCQDYDKFERKQIIVQGKVAGVRIQMMPITMFEMSCPNTKKWLTVTYSHGIDDKLYVSDNDQVTVQGVFEGPSSITASKILVSAAPDAEKPRIEPCDNTPLPDEVRQLLAQKFPSWLTARFGDLSDEEQNQWQNSKQRGLCPGIAKGHFESPTSFSYALLLVPTNPETLGFKIVVAGKKSGKYELKVVEDIENFSYAGNAIYTLPPGKYQDFYQEKTVTLTLDAFQWEIIYKGKAIMYYWKGGSYRTLITSD